MFMFAPILAATLIQRLGSVPILDWLLWLGSLALSVGLIVVLRMSWGQSRPLRKCAVLSLLVHALLACLAITVRVVVGEGGGGGDGPPIRVRIVNEYPQEAALADSPTDVTAAPALLEPPPEATTAQTSVAPAEVSEPIDAPPLLESQPPKTNTSSNVAEKSASDEPVPPEDDNPTQTTGLPEPVAMPPVANVTAEPSPKASATNTAPEEPAAVAATPVSTTPSSPGPRIDAAYSMRSSTGRLGLIQWQGGNEQTEAAVAAALAWLARAQSSDGRWEANRFGAGQEQRVLGQDRGGAGRNADTGISALAILAFLGAGYSHQEGEYQDTVKRGLEFLIRSQAADGNLFGEATLYAQMYCHSMATFGLAEAQAVTRDVRLEPAVAKAVAYCLRAQHTATGGWRYRPNEIGDTSQLGWQIMALASAERAGARVPSETWTRVAHFLRRVQRGTDGGLASYRPDGPPTTSMTAEALYCRLLLAETGGDEIGEPAGAEATRQLLAAMPNTNRMNLYYWYYATLAMHHRSGTSEVNAAAWRSWNDALTAALLETQVAHGPDAGSWNTNTIWGGYGGRVYTTAMAAMSLEVYYRYAPKKAGQHWTATRPADEPPL
jgi:Squalene-hopene cyclase C-terminal domain